MSINGKDKHAIAIQILSKIPGKGAKKGTDDSGDDSTEETEPEEGDDSTGEETAAKELLQAIKDEDPKALVEAFRALVEMCDTND